jgi:phenylalanyl-tRNA synthetase beta chain
MKISLNWLKTYIDINESPEELDVLLTGTGLEVEGIEEVETVPGGLKGFVLAEVLTCERFEVKEKKLSLCTVDIGTESHSQIVCGAANVAAGQRVVVATVGTTIYQDGKPLFEIASKKTYGHLSEGMICAVDELGLGSDHSGILVLDTDQPNGTPAAEYFKLESDHVIEIGLTPNRADAASHVGVARDLAAVLGRSIKWPSVDTFSVSNNNFPIALEVADPQACPRFCGVTIDGVTVKPSPEWLQNYLKTIGLNPINNIVDITNYICHGLGQPMHAYDWHEVKGQKIVVRYCEDGSKFTTLDKQERTLSATDLMICNAQEPMGIGGIFGGTKSGIKDSTTRVYLECAYFDPASIRKTATRHGLKTDASFRFERGTDPNMKLYAMKVCALLVQELAGGQIASEVTDFYPNPIPDFKINVLYKHIDRLIGKTLEQSLIHQILTSLDIQIQDQTAEGFMAIVPPYRVDVTREVDIVEEILRIYGFENVELSETLGTNYLANFPKKDPDNTQSSITQMLAGSGFSEIITNSLTKPAYSSAIKNDLPFADVEILNKLSEDLGVMRQTMLFSGLEVLAYNLNRQQKALKVFDFGKTYHLKESKYLEKKHLALFLTGLEQAESWQNGSAKVQFHSLANEVVKIFAKLKLQNLETKVIEQSAVFSYGLTYVINKKEVGQIGLVKANLCKMADIKQAVFYADLDWDYLLKASGNETFFQEIPRYPEVRRDLSLVLDKTVSFAQIKALAQKYEKSLLTNVNVFDLYEGTNLGEGKKSYSVSLFLQDREQTLTDKVIDKTMERLMAAYEKELGAVIRK